MSTPVHVDPETITQADGAQSSRVPVPLPDVPYVAVRQAQLVDTESEPEEAPSEAEELTNSSYSSALSDSTAPLSPDHPLTHVLPTPTPTRASFHRRTACMTVHAQPVMSHGHSTISDPSSTEEGHGLDDKGHGLDDKGHGLDDKERSVESDRLGLEVSEEEAVTEGQQQVVSAMDTAVVAPVQTPPSPEWSSGSFPISPSSPVVPSPIASPVATPKTTISVDKDQFIEIGAQDVRELYTRLGAVRDEILSQSLLRREVGAVSVTSPAGVLDLVDYSSSASDPLEDSLPQAPELPLVSPFLCSDDLEADSESEPA
ncbi:hypothetical protein Tco_0345535 [Tanacetum coccineum]